MDFELMGNIDSSDGGIIKIVVLMADGNTAHACLFVNLKLECTKRVLEIESQ